MATLLSDNFNRADSATVPGSPGTGGPYTVVTGTAGINGNRLYFPTVNTTNLGSHLTFPAAADVDMQATIAVIGSTSVSFGLLFRYTDASNTWGFEFNANAYKLIRYNAGSLLSWSSGIAPTAGDVIRVVAIGRRITGLLNGVAIIEMEDVFSVSATVCGVRDTHINNRLDDLTVVDASQFSESGYLYKGRDTKTFDLAGVA